MHLRRSVLIVLHFVQTSCGADGKLIVWDVSEEEPKEVEVLQGIIPIVTDTE